VVTVRDEKLVPVTETPQTKPTLVLVNYNNNNL